MPEGRDACEILTDHRKKAVSRESRDKRKQLARNTATKTRFITTGEVQWIDLRKSIEQKISAPKLHTV